MAAAVVRESHAKPEGRVRVIRSNFEIIERKIRPRKTREHCDVSIDASRNLIGLLLSKSRSSYRSPREL